MNQAKNIREGTRADILGHGFPPFVSSHDYILQAVRCGGLF